MQEESKNAVTLPRCIARQTMRAPPHFRRFALIGRSTLVAPTSGRVCEVLQLTFALPASEALDFRGGLAEHVKIWAPWARKPKSYSPISPPDRLGSFDLAVKIYPNGKYSAYIASLTVGDGVLISGPFPHPRFPLRRRGARALCVVAFGIGITGALPLVRAELGRGDVAHVALLHANRFQADTALGEELERLQDENEFRLSVFRAFSGEHVAGARAGRVNTAMLQELFQLDGGRDVCFHVVGSKSMIKATWKMLAQLGYPRRKYALLRKGIGGTRDVGEGELDKAESEWLESDAAAVNSDKVGIESLEV